MISDEEIDFPKVTDPDVVIVMSQEAYTSYAEGVKKGGTLLLDSDLVPKQKDIPNVRVFKVPATKMAEALGKNIVANVVMLGAFTAITSLIDAEAVKKSILANVPKGADKLNMDAFEKGYVYGKNLLKEKAKKFS